MGSQVTHAQPVYIWIYELDQPLRSQFGLYNRLTQTAHKLYLDRLSRPTVSRHAMIQLHERPTNVHMLHTITIQGQFYNFSRNTPIQSILEDFVFCILEILKYSRIQMSANWSCTVHTCTQTQQNVLWKISNIITFN